jgi:4-carboxymuconolactone decarboxylase
MIALNSTTSLLMSVAPKLELLREEVIHNDLWQREELSKRDRSLITIAALVAMHRTGSIAAHARTGIKNGLSAAEISEVIIHMAFYAGQPATFAACQAIQQVLDEV